MHILQSIAVLLENWRSVICCWLLQVHSCSDLLSSAERIILAVDADGPGIVLADELSRRIGREKCWRVTWPTSPQDSLAPGAGEAAAAAAAAAMAPAGSSSATAAGDAPAGVESSAVTAPADSKEQAAAAAAVVDAGLVASRWARKDANEVLMKDGADVLCAYLHAAQPLPIRGLFKFDDFFDQVGTCPSLLLAPAAACWSSACWSSSWHTA
jgi:twinkle protein